MIGISQLQNDVLEALRPYAVSQEPLPLRADFGKMLGMSRKSVVYYLGVLRKKGVIELDSATAYQRVKILAEVHVLPDPEYKPREDQELTPLDRRQALASVTGHGWWQVGLDQVA